MAHHIDNQFDASKTPLGRVGVLFPWADTNKIKPLDRAENPLAKEYQTDNRMVVLYSGNLGISHDIGSMLRAAEILKDRSEILFLFIGGGAKWQEAKNFQARKQLFNMQVRSYVPEELLPQSMALSDICLVALDPGAEGMMIPSKLFYYMSAGAAVVGICGADNDLQEVIERADCGICVGHGEPERLAEVIKNLADDPDRRKVLGRHAREAAVKEYTPEAGIAQCIDLLRQSGLDFS
jgi:glycosyltransferase involved in cell wall biosynthesis